MDGLVGYWYKIKISELVKSCPLSMNELNTFTDLNIIPLGYYDVGWIHIMLFWIVTTRHLLILTRKESKKW